MSRNSVSSQKMGNFVTKTIAVMSKEVVACANERCLSKFGKMLKKNILCDFRSPQVNYLLGLA